MFLKYLCEFLGTMMLILLGDGVVANVTLNKSGMKGAGSIQITIAWGLAVMVPAFIFGEASGASFNPALTIALAVGGMFDWALVPGYIIAQILGGIVGGVLVYILFKDHFDATEDPGTKLGVFSTGPSIPNTGRNIVQEAIATFVLVFAICGLNQVPELAAGVGKLLVFGIIVAIGIKSLSGLLFFTLLWAIQAGVSVQAFYALWASELFPAKYRAAAQGIMFFVVRGLSAVWGLCFVYIYGENGEGFYRASYIMIGLLMVSLLVGTIWTPKTRGKTLEQITKERYGDEE